MKKPVIIAIGSEKGGVGKTNSAVNLSSGLAHEGKKVLAIDMDRQSNLSKWLLKDFNPDKDKGIIHAMILDPSLKPSDVIYKTDTENLFVMPIERRVGEYRTEPDELISKENSGNTTLKLFLEKEDLSFFDYIIIDNKPSLGSSSIASLLASDFFLVPLGVDDNEIDGATQFISEAFETTASSNPSLQFLGFVFVAVNNSLAKTKKVREQLAPVTKGKINHEISTRALYNDLPGLKQTVYQYKEKKQKDKQLAREEYTALAKSVIEMAKPITINIQKPVFKPSETRA